MGACFCTGRCRKPPYRCAAGDFSARHDPNYEENLKAQAILEFLMRQAEIRRKRRADAERRRKNPGPWAAPVVVPLESDDSGVVPLTAGEGSGVVPLTVSGDRPDNDYERILDIIRREQDESQRRRRRREIFPDGDEGTDLWELSRTRRWPRATLSARAAA